MKFTQNTPVVSPREIGNVAVRNQPISTDHIAGGKIYDAYVSGMSQVLKVAQQQQDDMDAADHMNRRNIIMGNITKRLYGEDGLITNGVGINAKGLTDRVQQVVQEEFERGMEGANQRVRRSMAGTYNENMGNYQRIAAQQEGREFNRQKEIDYNANQGLNIDRAVAGYRDNNSVTFAVNDGMQLLHYRAKDQGWSNAQFEQEKRKLIGAIAGSAIQTAIDSSDLEQADNLLTTYGPQMDQTARLKFDNILKKNSDIKMSREKGADLLKRFGGDKEKAKDYLYNVLGTETVSVGGGSGVYSGDAQTDALIQKFANKYNIPVDLLAALGSAESDFNNGAVSGVGAKGMFQLMPDTAASLGVDPDTLEGNIEGGAKYLRQMLDTFGGNEDLAIAAYNAGPGAVKAAGNQIPNITETQNHVKKVRERRGRYKGGVSFEKLDSDIDASGVKIDGAQPQTIGMINRAKQIYKNLFGKDDFWVSSVTGGHNDGTPHALGYKADVGGSALKESYENRIKFQQALQAEGIGANNEYDQPSEGSTGPHFDLDSRGKNWQTGEDFGGFKGGGYTKKKYSEAQLNAIWKQYETQLIDHNQAEAYQKSERVKSYIDGAKGMSSQSDVVAYMDRVKADPSISTDDYNKIAGSVFGYYGLTRDGSEKGTRGGSGGGGRGSKEKVHGENGYYGKSGKWYTMAQYQEATRAAEEYKRLAELSKQGLYTIGDRQSYFNKETEILNDIWDNNYTDNAMIVTKGAFNRAKGNFYGTMRILQEEYGMAQDEAARYINRYLGMQPIGMQPGGEK